jgi:Pyridoxamine 5'-phosphate oxidase
MATWREFEESAPHLAAIGRKALWHEKQGLNFAFLATIRKDGSPRLHPVCPTICDGRLYVVAEGKTPKRYDLKRNGSYALHAVLDFEFESRPQFYISGFAHEANDPDTRRRVEATYREWTFSDEEVVFELSIERALHTVFDKGYIHTKWSAPCG